uniref:Ig-like domain-containing protein n=1 Tax=Electrophorus electricus TaxID=8005 RepID=A0A4W4E2R4_ELEEL
MEKMDHKRTVTKALLILAVSVHLSSADVHSLKYLHIGLTQGTNFPMYTSVGLLDGEEFVYYDSNIRKRIPKTEWIEKNEDPDYWNSETQTLQDHEEWFRVNMATLMKRFSQTDGTHTWQWTYGCELHDDGTVRGYNQYGYDGEDFVTLDLNTLTWTAAKSEAHITKQKMEADRSHTEYQKYYLENTCIDYLNKYIGFRNTALKSKVPPKVTLFRKDSSSPVVCHATGFFPREVMISWQKNGEDLHENVEFRETSPNEDGTFQKRIILTVSSEDLKNNDYTCVVQHSGLKKDLVLRVDECRVLNTGCPKANRRKRSADEGSNCAESGSHSLQYFYTAVTPGINFPEFTAVGLVDGEQFDYYDSNIRKDIPKTEWMEKSVGADYWSRQTQTAQGDQETFKVNIGTLMERFNQTNGVHTWQNMYGCELHDDGTKRGYDQYGYDGEDFISLDLNTLTWTAANAKAVITKNKWEPTQWAFQDKAYLENTCIEWLQKYVAYGRDTLERKDPPEVTLFQKDSSSPAVCHATGFFPRGVEISWQKNGVDLHENVELRETSPNQNGTFQKRSVLTVSPEELDKNEYTCVVQHSGLEKDLVLRVADRRVLNTGGALVGVIVGILVAVLLLVLIGVGFFIWRKRNEKSSDFRPVARSDGESSSTSSNEGQPAKC